MAVTKSEIRSGAYYDSVILMQLQRSLAELAGILDAGVVMGTEANRDILQQTGLLTREAEAAAADDLVIVVLATDEDAAGAALSQVDSLLSQRRASTELDDEYRPKSLESAAAMLPEARWVLISVPGRYAAGVAREALRLGKNVFLYSDNVPVEDEVALKKTAASKGLLVMGPDCGTAIVNGVGLGFANKVRPGPIGLVAASGTGLQQVSARIHQLGGGVTQALGTGGRDLKEAVGALTARQALDLLRRDAETEVIVLISKPPAREVAADLLAAARATGKPVVVDFIGYAPATNRVDNLYFATTFDAAATLAVELAASDSPSRQAEGAGAEGAPTFAKGQQYLRGLYSGGTLAYEALLLLRDYVPRVYSNIPLDEKDRLPNSLVSQAHTVIDLGEDEFTVGRLHPMMDNDLRIRRLHQEAEDPEVAVILLDVVLGYGAHPDPASELAPAVADAKAKAEQTDRTVEVVAVVVGTDEDPQDMATQIEQMEEAGARVHSSHDEAIRYAGDLLRSLQPVQPENESPAVDLEVLRDPLAALNAGLESFAQSLIEQEAAVVHVDWRPPAGGNEKLMAILARMKG
ncbi:MAG: acyl-CoA synthetase FdrA [Anaerolineae bacterium]|jgi:FdrA protein